MSLDSYHQERLERLRDEYGNRRTVTRQMLDQAVRLVESTTLELQARHEMQLAEADRQHQWQLDRVERRATVAEDRVRQLEAMRTNLRESREAIEEGVLVKITSPRAVNWRGEESEMSRPWTLAELETVVYRLRVGGGTDDTEVRIKRDHTEATIPYPELVLEAPTTKSPPEIESADDAAMARWLRSRRIRLAVSALNVVVALALFVLTIGRVA